jgi:DNA repair protein RecN (Recombination protein N)
MLVELHVQNLAIIEDLDLLLGSGFNVLTGETGAGKSIIIEALGLLLGEKVDQEALRAGESRAQVEGQFQPGPVVMDGLSRVLLEHGLEGDNNQLILAREIRRGGRSVSRINGRAVSSLLLREVGEHLVDIHGQGQHLSLMRVREHVRLLDRYAALSEYRLAFGTLVGELRTVQGQLARLQQDERQLARRLDLLRFQIGEIDSARLRGGEEEGLKSERNRLANAELLTRLSDEVCRAIEGGDGEVPSATDLLGEAVQHLLKLERVDSSLQPQRLEAESIAAALQELSSAVRAYVEGIEYSPQRLQQLEDRLGLIFSLKRKYGDSVAEIIDFGASAQRELDGITHAEERIEELQVVEDRLLHELGDLGQSLSSRRQEASESLAAAVERELADLSMEGARFGVSIAQVDDASGVFVNGRRLAFDHTGVDRVEFLVSANPGEPLRPLVKVASGGETSRLMLALKTVLSHADATPTLVFDEIDTGIGGRAGAVVGRKLWGLTLPASAPDAYDMGHQVLCVTHLPQIAAYADAHIEVSKSVVDNRTVTRATTVEGDARLRELASMLGAQTAAGRQSIQDLLDEVAFAKQSG